MKKTFLILFPLLAVIAIGGCNHRGDESTINPSSSSLSTSTITSSSITSTTTTSSTGPKPGDQHVTGISISPTKPFIAQVGDVRKFTVSHSGSPTDQTEKAVEWKVSDNTLASIELVGSSEYYKNADITFLKPGIVTVTVTSLYNSLFTKSVNVTIVEKSEYSYLWNCSSGDKNKFPTIDEGLPTPQYVDGYVTLNGLTWFVTRYEASTAPYGSQNIQFGYGDKEGALEFTLVNSKEVESIQVGCSSKPEVIGVDPETGRDITADYGSSKISISVNNVTYLESVNTEKGTNPEAVVTPTRTSFESGDIKISFTASVGYIAIQNIYIRFTHKLSSLNVDSSHCKTTFELGDSFNYQGLVAKAKYTNDSLEYDVSDFVNVATPDLSSIGEKTVNVSYTNSSVTVYSSYKINVINPRTLQSVVFDGSPLITQYYAGEAMNYGGLTIVATYLDSSSEVLQVPTQNQGDFTNVNVPDVANFAMNNAWSISLTYKGIDIAKNFASGTFQVLSSSVSFNMQDETLSGYNTYDEIIDSTGVVNMHIAGSSEEEVMQKTGGYPVVYNKHSIVFTSLDNNVCFKSISFTFAPYITGSTPKTETGTITAKQSIFGTGPFATTLGSISFVESDTTNKVLTATSLTKGCNSIEISFSSSNHFGVVEFAFELTSQEHAVPLNITYSGQLAKQEYHYGEKFDPSGLTFQVNFSNGYAPETIIEPEINIAWDELVVGQTYVNGTFLEMIVTITGITVSEYEGRTFVRVTENLADFTGTYLITCVAQNSIWNGSLTKSGLKGEGENNFYNVIFEEDYNSITADYITDHATFTITKQSSGNYYIVSSSGYYCGLTASGGLQVVDENNKREVAISILSNNAIISNNGIEGTTQIKQIGNSKTNGKYSTYASGSSSDKLIQLFKLDD